MTRLMFAVIEAKDDDIDQEDMALYLDCVASRPYGTDSQSYEYTVYESLEDLKADVADGVFDKEA